MYMLHVTCSQDVATWPQQVQRGLQLNTRNSPPQAQPRDYPESAPLRHLGPLADLPLVVLEHQRRLDHVGEPALTSAGRRTSMHLSSEKTRSADAELGA